MARAFAAKYVSDPTSRAPVVVFFKNQCPYSHLALRVLKEIGVRREVMETYDISTLDEVSMTAVQDELEAVTGERTVPRVFVGGKCIGGADDVMRDIASGKLLRQLKEAKALPPAAG